MSASLVESVIRGVADPGLLRAELLHELFEQQASQRTGSVALIFVDKEMTYGEVESQANQLARLLRGKGVGRGDCVGLWLPRSSEAIVALLGILKAGAAYVPLDAEYPAERVKFILADCGARALVTIGNFARQLEGFDGDTIRLDECRLQMDALPGGRLEKSERDAKPDELCYIIYTSGTTGQPKGVEIEHRNACHLVRAEGRIFQALPSDRVYQGFSLAFDASVEEVWLAFFAGAILVVGTAEMVRSGTALSRKLVDAGVTILSCVPTLLAMMEEDVPTLRLLILGGEACPPDLVKRWWKPERRLVNTYGPTEATVIATFADCEAGKPVTIGLPIPNYLACILDEKLKPVAPGEAGELCLGGAGLARGYVGRPELTREKFVELDLEEDNGKRERFYRTGDFVRQGPTGEIEFLGRIDSQVKIRGFRVELSEIDAILMECSGVRAAAVTLREDTPGTQRLVAYVVPGGPKAFDEKAVRASLRERLPPYMVPGLFEVIPAIPLSTAGKVDRKRLPLPKSQSAIAERNIVPAQNEYEQEILRVWSELFAPTAVSVTDDFFLELGGHSLLAARMVSRLRKDPPFAEISVADVYGHPTVEKLAAEFARRGTVQTKRAKDSFQPTPFWRHFFCGAGQFVSLFFILTFFALQWLTPYLTYTIMVEEDYSFPEAIVCAFASLILFYPIMLMIPIAVKWLLIGRYRPGSYPLWGWFYFRWWFATTLEAAVPVAYLSGTPLMGIYLRLMGAKIGRDVHIGTDAMAIYDLLSIGDGSSINADSTLLGYTVEDGLLKIGAITIGKNCFVGARSTLRENTAMEDNSALEDLSLLSRGSRIPRGQTWLGSPAKPVRSEEKAPEDVLRLNLARRFAFGVLHGIGLLIFPVLVVAAIFPGIAVMNKLNYLDPYYWYLLLAPLAGLSFIVLLALEIVVIKWLFLGRIRAGDYRTHSFFYFRKWFVDQTLNLSLEILGPLYASVYLTPWYKALGAKLGRGAEISTASFISPDLLAIGDESFIADSVSLGAARVRDGRMKLGRNEIGKRSFIGNSAMLPPDAVVGDSVLIGCLSRPPFNAKDALREDSTWMGSPPIFLPQRQHSAAFSEQQTFKPGTKLRILRAAIEFVRVIAPSTGFIVLISLMFSALLLLRDYFTLAQTLLFFPLLYLGGALAAGSVMIAAKWLLVWRYRPSEYPLWSTFVWRNELLNALHEHLANPFLVGPMTGTPFVCWYFRLLGAKIGRRVYLETTDFSEFDLVRIGDEAMLNADCTIQTHLFEDRVMKMDKIEIGVRCKVGAVTLVLYDTRMEDEAVLNDLSLLMKGEVLPAATEWEGIPARPSMQNDRKTVESVVEKERAS